MAGALLIILKNEKKDFTKIKSVLSRYFQENFKNYFEIINILEPNDGALLVEFRKDNKEKFYKDTDGNWLTYEGHIFDLHKTKVYSAKELLNIYKTEKNDMVDHLDGHFVIKGYNKKEDSYFVINDFIHYKPNFIAENKDYLMVTPFIFTSGLLFKPEIDEYAVNEFLWKSYILSERTLIKNVNRLSPASVYTIKNGKIGKYRYWQLPKQYTNLSFDECAEKMKESLKETARLVSENYEKPLLEFTMGQDSRTIVAAFKNQNLPFDTAIYGKDSFYEIKNVKRMSEKYQFNNTNIKLEEDFIDDIWKNFKKAILLGSSGLTGFYLTRVMYMREKMKKIGNPVLNGVGAHCIKGGLWTEQYMFNFYRETNKINYKSFLKYRFLSKNYRSDIFKNDFLEIKAQTGAYFKEMIKKSTIGYEKSPIALQIDKFDLDHHSNVGFTSNNVSNMIMDLISPFLLRRNLELAHIIPAKWKHNLSPMQRKIVFDLAPDLAKEPTSFGGVNMVPKNIITYIPFYAQFFWFGGKKFLNKIKSVLGLKTKKTLLQDAWDYKPIYINLFQNKEFQNNLTFNNMFLSKILEKNEWNKFIDDMNAFTEEKKLSEFEFMFSLVGIETVLSEANKLNIYYQG